jgi:hypothetical protein
MRAAALQQADLATYRVPAGCVDAVAHALSRPPVAPASGGAGGSSLDTAGRASGGSLNIAGVPIDELLLESLVKVAGGAKKGTTAAPSRGHTALVRARAGAKHDELRLGTARFKARPLSGISW